MVILVDLPLECGAINPALTMLYGATIRLTNVRGLEVGVKVGADPASVHYKQKVVQLTLFSSGIRPAIDDYLALEAAKVRDYGDYWSASSAGYCQRKLIFERLGIPPVSKEGDERKTRVFEAGHIFHEWVQRITRESGLSIAQELELQVDELMVRGHIDDLVLVDGRLILMDYKTQHSNAFTWQKGKPASYFHKMQVGTYMYMLQGDWLLKHKLAVDASRWGALSGEVKEARILKISKDDLRMDENQILWSEELSSEVRDYWTSLNKHWAERKMPPCTCHVHENGFLAKEKYNPYFFNGKPCSIELYNKFKKEKVNG
jgi:hypothetical protein